MATIATGDASAGARGGEGRAPGAIRVAALPALLTTNPYQRLLYEALEPHGVHVVAGASLTARWLAANRAGVEVLHFHWPQAHYRHKGRTRGARSWVKLGLFAWRLAVARALGYRLVWTVHQVYPHERGSLAMDRIAARLLAAASHLLLAHDEATAQHARRELGRLAAGVEVVPHGNYAGAYPPGRGRSEVRAELGVPDGAVAFLCFGDLRGYKDVDLLIGAFADAGLEDAALVVAGASRDERVAADLRAAAERDPRVRLLVGFVPDERVAELYGACDVAVIARGDGGTSGALVLALSLGTPVVAADAPAYRELTRGGEAGWHFRPGDRASLAETLREAASDRDAIRAKAAAAARCGEALDRGPIARRTAELIRRTRPRRRGRRAAAA